MNGLRVTLLALLWHLLNFVVPAAGVGLLLALVLRWRHGRAFGPAWWRLTALGVVVLIAGWVVFGHDGAMGTYTALVLSQATLAWWWERPAPAGRGRR